jgi:hypothetical protein
MKDVETALIGKPIGEAVNVTVTKVGPFWQPFRELS